MRWLDELTQPPAVRIAAAVPAPVGLSPAAEARRAHVLRQIG
jgi:hypothetical protein